MGVAAVEGPSSPSRFGRRARRVGLGCFFASVVFNAALGIAALIAGDFSETHGRVLGTSLSVTGALVLALACLPAWERRRLGFVPLVGVGLGVVAFGLVVAGIWASPDGETLARITGTFMAPAVACAVACVLAYPTLAPRFRPVLAVALTLLAVAAVMVVVAIWTEPESSWYARALGVVAVLLAAVAVSIPVLHRAGQPPRLHAAATSYCPFCGAEHRAEAERSTSCGRCGQAFTVRPAG